MLQGHLDTAKYPLQWITDAVQQLRLRPKKNNSGEEENDSSKKNHRVSSPPP